MNFLAKLIATVFFLGYIPLAPGTIGTLVGILVYLSIKNFNPLFYILFTLLFFIVSTWAAHQTERLLGETDPSQIIIDETASFLVTMFLIPCSIKIICAGFLLNRFFDITKIYPANLADKKVKGGWGIMLDDLVAGIYSCLVLHLLIYLFPLLKT